MAVDILVCVSSSLKYGAYGCAGCLLSGEGNGVGQIILGPSKRLCGDTVVLEVIVVVVSVVEVIVMEVLSLDVIVDHCHGGHCKSTSGRHRSYYNGTS